MSRLSISHLAFGFHPSTPASTFSNVMSFASISDSCLDHATRLFLLAPGPVLLNSAYRAVFSLSGLSQLCHPSGRTTSSILVLRKITAAKERHGLPRYVFTSGESPVIVQFEKTKPN